MNESPIFNRYFRVVGGKLGELLLAQLNRRTEYVQKLNGLARSVNAVQVHTWAHTGDFAGFSFPDSTVLDEALWQRTPHGYWVPRRGKNRTFWKHIRDLGVPGSPQDCLREFGLDPHRWMHFKGEPFGCKVTGFYEADVWWVEVPSRHFDAGSLTAAALAKASGQSGTDPINSLWLPPPDWVEVTVGQYLDEWDELRQQELDRNEPTQ